MDNVFPGKYHILMDVIMAASSEAICVYAAEDRPALFIEVNKRCCELLEYSREELFQKSVQDITVTDDHERLGEWARELSQKGNLVFETAWMSKNGKKVPVEISASIVEINDKKIVINLARETTERKQMESRLKESEEKFRMMFEYSNDMIWTLDTEGNFLFFNKCAEKLSGYKSEDWKGKSFAPLLDPVDLPQVIEIFRKTLSGEPQQYEVIFRNKAGGKVILSVNTAPLYSQGNIIGTVSFGRDITERKQVEDMLVESRERYKNLIANIPGVVFRCTADGERTMSFISEEINRISEFPVEDFVDNAKRSFMSIIHLEDRSQVEENINFALKKRQPYFLEYRIVDRKEHIHWVRERGQGIYDLIGNVLWIDGVVFDVTEQKYMEIEIQKRVIDLERFQAVTIERENRIIALKEKIKQLERFINESRSSS